MGFNDASLESAWELGIKVCIIADLNLYKEQVMLGVEADNTKQWPSKNIVDDKTDYEECLSCQ